MLLGAVSTPPRIRFRCSTARTGPFPAPSTASMSSSNTWTGPIYKDTSFFCLNNWTLDKFDHVDHIILCNSLQKTYIFSSVQSKYNNKLLNVVFSYFRINVGFPILFISSYLLHMYQFLVLIYEFAILFICLCKQIEAPPLFYFQVHGVSQWAGR